MIGQLNYFIFQSICYVKDNTPETTLTVKEIVDFLEKLALHAFGLPITVDTYLKGNPNSPFKSFADHLAQKHPSKKQ